MKRVKKLGVFLLALFMTIFVMGSTSATPSRNPEVFEPGGSMIMPRASYQILNEDITQRGVSWQQPAGYIAYRVWVSNTTDEVMTVTIRSDGGTFTAKVPANSNKTVVTVNNAWENEEHTIDFQTSSGAVTGTVTVRVSDTIFT